MKILDIRGYDSEKIISAEFAKSEMMRKNFKDNAKKLEDRTVFLMKANDRYYLTSFSGQNRIGIEISDRGGSDFVDDLLDRRQEYLAGVVSADADGIVIRIVCYYDSLISNTKCVYTLDFEKRLKQKVTLSDVGNIPKSLLKISALKVSPNEQRYVAAVNTAQKVPEKQPDMVIICSSAVGYIHLKHITRNNMDILECTALTHEFPDGDYRRMLLKGQLKFIPHDRELDNTLSMCAAIEKVRTDSKSFFRIWNKYGEYEFRKELSTLAETGAMKCECEHNGKNIMLFLPDAAKNTKRLENLLQEGTSGASLTLWESDPTEIVSAISQLLRDSETDPDVDIVGSAMDLINKSRNENKHMVTLADKFNYYDFLQTHRIPVTSNQNIAEGKYYFTYSIEGDSTIFKRRVRARNNIAEGKIQMKQLVAILENVYDGCSPENRRKPIEALTPGVEKEIFGGYSPTETQREAIRIALNTPDIAIIQGPPGTGKTTVITAIVRRLNEISGDSDNIFGQNLISAFQHDAVNNAISRMDNFGLPVIKIGEKRTLNYSEERAAGISVENWMLAQREKVAGAHPEIGRFLRYKEFEDKYKIYLGSGSVSMAVSVLESAWELLGQMNQRGSDTGKYIYNWLMHMKGLNSSNSEENQELIDALYRIPLNAVQYEDGGEMMTRKAMVRLQGAGSQYIREIEINELEKFIGGGDDRDYQTIRKLRNRLISRLKPKPKIFADVQDNAAVICGLNKFMEMLRNYRDDSDDPQALEADIISDYYDSLCNNHSYVFESILSYSSVSGATNQHSASLDIFSRKSDQYYENVIVDEAARSNPLDLMIPMSLARDRIILVGDHRQLPHMLDNDIAKKVEDDVKIQNGDDASVDIQKELSYSMFERLKRILTELEKKDGIRRCITLDEQYRTHPLLGDFVSRTFYESKDVTERFRSPRGAEQFAHSLPGIENKAAVWLEVPASLGGEERAGSSCIRRAEARSIAAHLKRMMDIDAGRNMTFGVITFYSGQVREIMKALAEIGIAEKVPHSEEYRLCDSYASAIIEKGGKSERVEKLRVGSLDAFQGMEFDVVYLSMVRCNQENKFGFLTVENRLCVAMSRQKKLLIAVGDSGMFTNVAAERKIPAVYAFRKQLCEENKEYGAII